MGTLDRLAGLLLTTLLWLTEIHTVVARCNVGWTEGTKACYKVFDIKPRYETWHEANSSCARAVRGGMLATTDNRRDSDIVVDLMLQYSYAEYYTWIGLNSGGKNLGDNLKDGWQWADGTKHDISDLDLWGDNQPVLYINGSFGSVYADRSSGPYWVAFPDYSVLSLYACQRQIKETTTPKPTTTTPTPTSTRTTTSQPTRTRPTTEPTPTKSSTPTTTTKLSNTPSSADSATTGASVATSPASYNIIAWAIIAAVIVCVILAVVLACRSGDQEKPSPPSESQTHQSQDATQSSTSSSAVTVLPEPSQNTSSVIDMSEQASSSS